MGLHSPRSLEGEELANCIWRPKARRARLPVPRRQVENFSGTFVRAEDCDPISDQMFAEFRRSQAVPGDILIAIGGYVGRPAIVQSIRDGLKLNINRHLARFRPDPSKVIPYFALAYMSSPIGKDS